MVTSKLRQAEIENEGGTAGPSPRRAIEQYRVGAESFDRKTRRSMAFRDKAVELLQLREGDVVLDIACGTGLNFDAIEQRIGPSGRLIGVDLSPDMLTVAGERVASRGWDNVTLHQADIEDLRLDLEADAVLFSLAHDVLRSDEAIAAVLRHLRPGARIAVFGAKWAPAWNLPVRISVWRRARQYMTTFEGFHRPWDKLERQVPGLSREEVAFGSAYLIWGSVGAGSFRQPGEG